MTDTRFATVVDDTEQLLDVLDLDDINDVETLLMFLFARPIAVVEVWTPDRDEACLEVILPGGDEANSASSFGFPLSVFDLVRSCAHEVDRLGPDGAETRRGVDAPRVAALGDDGLVTALQGALGKVRLFNMVDDES